MIDGWLLCFRSLAGFYPPMIHPFDSIESVALSRVKSETVLDIETFYGIRVTPVIYSGKQQPPDRPFKWNAAKEDSQMGRVLTHVKNHAPSELRRCIMDCRQQVDKELRTEFALASRVVRFFGYADALATVQHEFGSYHQVAGIFEFKKSLDWDPPDEQQIKRPKYNMPQVRAELLLVCCVIAYGKRVAIASDLGTTRMYIMASSKEIKCCTMSLRCALYELDRFRQVLDLLRKNEPLGELEQSWIYTEMGRDVQFSLEPAKPLGNGGPMETEDPLAPGALLDVANLGDVYDPETDTPEERIEFARTILSYYFRANPWLPECFPLQESEKK